MTDSLRAHYVVFDWNCVLTYKPSPMLHKNIKYVQIYTLSLITRQKSNRKNTISCYLLKLYTNKKGQMIKAICVHCPCSILGGLCGHFVVHYEYTKTV